MVLHRDRVYRGGHGSALAEFCRMIFLVFGAGFAVFCSFFFRDPDRPLPEDALKIYSPGDGKVLSVAKEGPGDVTTIRIFLSIFDVHVQRAPCSGVVDRIQYVPGSFALAMRPEAMRNERNIVRIAPEAGRELVLVEQIAGFIARRIECWASVAKRSGLGSAMG